METVGISVKTNLGLWVHAMIAVVGLWTFYTLLFWGCLVVLPQHMQAGEELLVLGAALLSLFAVGFSGLISPWLLDRLLNVTWIRLEEAGDVGPHLRRILDSRHLPTPRLGVVIDTDPCAMTYGPTWGSARLLVTSGLLEATDVDAQCAIVSHEAGHLASGDFRVATLFAGPILILGQLRGLFNSSEGRFGAVAAVASGGTFTGGGFLPPLLGTLGRVYTLFFAGFAQARELWADRFAAEETSAQALQNALLTMLNRLARSPALQHSHSLAVAARGFSPLDAYTAGRLGTAAAWDGKLDRARILTMMQIVALNPASALSQQSALHPPSGPRIGARPGATPNAWIFLREFLPATGFAVGLALSLGHGGWFGLPLILWGTARLAWLALSFRRAPERIDSAVGLRDVLEKLGNEPARAYRARLEGAVAGNGVPGQTWCPDLVLEVAGDHPVYVALRPRVVVGATRTGIEEMLRTKEGKPCVAWGVLRMLDVPFLELHAIDFLGERTWRSNFVAIHSIGSLLLLIFGVLIMAPQWAGF